MEFLEKQYSTLTKHDQTCMTICTACNSLTLYGGTNGGLRDVSLFIVELIEMKMLLLIGNLNACWGTTKEKTAKFNPIYYYRLVNMLVNRILKHEKKNYWLIKLFIDPWKKLDKRQKQIHYLFYVKQYME